MKFQIVMAHYNEDIEWSNKYSEIRKIYSKSPNPLDVEHVKLKNVGRESHTYFHHIIENYDNLADYTFFCQGNPYEHFFEGFTVEDYLVETPYTLYISGCTDFKLNYHMWREGYQGHEAHCGIIKPQYKQLFTTLNRERIEQLRTEKGFWNRQEEWFFPRFSFWPDLSYSGQIGRATILNFTWILPSERGYDITTFSKEYLGFDYPRPIYYSMGGQFTVSKEVIRARPIEFYERLIPTLDYDWNPPEGYYFEAFWYYLWKTNMSL
jgi:hypothetical protein